MLARLLIESQLFIPACSLSPAPVQKYPIFFGLMLLPVKPGLLRGGVGSCRTGRGIERPLTIGSVTPGIDGIKDPGSEICGSGSGSGTGVANATEASAIQARENFVMMVQLVE